MLKLKTGKDKPVRNKHHWIFSGAVEKISTSGEGEIVPVHASSGDLLGHAYVNKRSSILARMVSFNDTDPMEAIRRSILRAVALRSELIASHTTAYRLINGEGDALPGLIVDRYNDYLVIQIATLGMQKIRSFLIECLNSALNPRGIYEKSLLPTRKEEGLGPCEELLFGTLPDEIEVFENGYRFLVNPRKGQKTGFFLDQREMRKKVGELSANKKVLNCFSYTGGFSVYAAGGKALKVDSVDCSKEAIALAERNMAINQLSGGHGFFAEDVFEFLKRPLDYDLVILDPPAFAKRAKDQIQACRGYKEINRLAMKSMKSGSLLVTCSCSYHVDESLFQKVIFQAALEAGKNARIISRHLHALDHPINLFHPEGDYLKSLILYIE